MTAIDYESLLPLSLIRSYTKTDDDVYVTDEELQLLRAAAFKELRKYNTKVNLTGQRDVQQQVLLKMSAAGYIYDQKIDLDYPATSAFVTVEFNKAPSVKIKVAYEATFIYLALDDQMLCYSPCRSPSPVAILYYQTGSKCPSSLDETISLGCLRYIDFALVNRNNDKKIKSIAIDSGAYRLWKS